MHTNRQLIIAVRLHCGNHYAILGVNERHPMFESFASHGIPAAHRSRLRIAFVYAVVLGSIALVSDRARAQEHAPLDGLWDAIVVSNGTEIPFRFEIATKGPEVQGFFFEGDRKVGSSSGTYADGVLKLEYDFLNTILEAKYAEDQLTGTYRTNRPNARPQEVRMRRFAPVPIGQQDPPSLAGTNTTR